MSLVAAASAPVSAVASLYTATASAAVDMATIAAGLIASARLNANCALVLIAIALASANDAMVCPSDIRVAIRMLALYTPIPATRPARVTAKSSIAPVSNALLRESVMNLDTLFVVLAIGMIAA